MALNIKSTTNHQLSPRIVVIGVGGAGCNAVNNMIDQGLGGVEFIVANTDAQSLNLSRAEKRIQLGSVLTRGLGAGADPEVGRQAAEEVEKELHEYLADCNMLFITAGMGGGTGTGAAPVIARVAKEMGILTVGVVTKPFDFEGSKRRKLSEEGIKTLQEYVGTLIVIPNQNLFRIANERTTFAEAFTLADQVLCSGVRGITDLIVVPGLINLDFADIRTVMSEMGKAMMGTGEADGANRAIDVAEKAISNPLLEDVTMKGAKQVLINITGGDDLTLFEIDAAVNRIREEVLEDAHIHFGAAFDKNLSGKMRLSVVATGIDSGMVASQTPTHKPMNADFGVISRPQPAPVAKMEMPKPQVNLVQQPVDEVVENTMTNTMVAQTEPVVETPANLNVQANVQPAVANNHWNMLQPDAPVAPESTDEETKMEHALHDEQPTQQAENIDQPNLVQSEMIGGQTPGHQAEIAVNNGRVEPVISGFIPPVPTPLANDSTNQTSLMNGAPVSGANQNEALHESDFDNAGSAKRPARNGLGSFFGFNRAPAGQNAVATNAVARDFDKAPMVSPLERLQEEQKQAPKPELAVVDGQKTDENLDIPAFLRRQAN